MKTMIYIFPFCQAVRVLGTRKTGFEDVFCDKMCFLVVPYIDKDIDAMLEVYFKIKITYTEPFFFFFFNFVRKKQVKRIKKFIILVYFIWNH